MKRASFAFAVTFSITFALTADEQAHPAGTAPASPIGPSNEKSHPGSDSPYAIRPVFREPGAESRILTLYGKLRKGQSRLEVQKILGAPLIGSPSGNESEYWYINETERRTYEGSPWGWGGIKVSYDEDDLLVSATVNPQYVSDKHLGNPTGKPAGKEDQGGSGPSSAHPDLKTKSQGKRQPDADSMTR